jgi:hypothetical protein
MSEYKWNVNEFDAIRIVAANGEFEIAGTDANEIVLEGEGHSRHRFRGGDPTIAGRWLNVNPFGGGSEWSLALPKTKAWVIEISCGSGEVNIENVHARLNVQMGSGEVQVEDCRGTFNVRSGSGDVSLENCVQASVPDAPERVEWEQRAGENFVPPTPGVPPVPPVPPTPGVPPIPPIPPIGVKVRVGRRKHADDETEWEDYENEWEFSRNFAFGFKFSAEDEDRRDGIHVQLGSGDIRLEDVDALVVTTRTGSGDLQIEQGRIAELEVENHRGDIQIEGVLPTTAWELTTRHGDIQVVLPGDAYARIDAATRHGEIECDAPLVRVGRPGPGARHGGRMVGTIGEGDGEPVDIHLESQHGDIQIEVERRPSRFAGQKAPQPHAREGTQGPSAGSAREPMASSEQAMPASKSDEAGEPVNEALSREAESNAQQTSSGQAYDSQFAILEALQAGEITVAEAEMLLRSLKG